MHILLQPNARGHSGRFFVEPFAMFFDKYDMTNNDLDRIFRFNLAKRLQILHDWQ